MVSLFPILLSSALAAAPVKPVVAVLPVHGATPELRRLGSLLEARGTALIAASGAATVLDVKQVLAMAGQEGLDPDHLAEPALADQSLGLLGADRVIALSLKQDGANLVLEGSVRDNKKPADFSARLPLDWAQALDEGSVALARALGAKDLPPGVQPTSASAKALEALAPCWETALRQPMGLDAPIGLSSADLDAARASCKTALTLDPSLRFAATTLGLLQAIARDDVDAEKVLGPSADSDPALVPWVLARFWLLTRNQSNDAAVKFLAAVIAKHPNQLVLRSLQASALAAMNEHVRAETAWKDYLALSPSSAFANGRLSRSLARQGKLEPALAAARRGLQLAPSSREARLALAARQLDAGKLADARQSLQPLVDLPKAPAEPLLQLGLAYQAAGDLKSAQQQLELAAQRATGPRAPRTKGRATYQLAVIAMKQGQTEAAKKALERSLETGFRMVPPDPSLASLAPAEAPAGAGTGGGLYLSLAPLTDAGPLTPTASELAAKLEREKLTTMGVTFAPAGEEKAAALGALKAKSLQGYEVRLTVAEAGKGLKVDLLVLSYPELALKGDWSVKASGAKPEALLKAMVPRVIDDAAGDLDWKN